MWQYRWNEAILVSEINSHKWVNSVISLMQVLRHPGFISGAVIKQYPNRHSAGEKGFIFTHHSMLENVTAVKSHWQRLEQRVTGHPQSRPERNKCTQLLPHLLVCSCMSSLLCRAVPPARGIVPSTVARVPQTWTEKSISTKHSHRNPSIDSILLRPCLPRWF